MSNVQRVSEEDLETQKENVLEGQGLQGRERSRGRVEGKGQQRKKQE